jgi:hypothetical protein
MKGSTLAIASVAMTLSAGCGMQSTSVAPPYPWPPSSATTSAQVSYSPQIAPVDPFETAKEGGCIGKPLDACLTALQVGFHFGPYQRIADEMKENEAVDVNGKPLRPRKVLTVSGNLVGWEGISRLLLVDLDYTDARIVSRIEITLPSDPGLANTEDEYAKTGIYEAMVLLLGSTCPNVTRLEAYKFFQNDVKPKIVSEGKKIEIHDTNAETSYFRKALNVPFCGRKFSYTNLFGYDTDDITLENPHGAFIHTSIAFE